LDLAAEFAQAHPDDPLRHYYQGWASLQAERYKHAIALLVPGIEGSPEQPALLWYLLGRAYTGTEAWPEAILSLETARDLLERDDTSMAAHTGQPVADLFVALGRAHLGAGRCAEAETMLAYGISVGDATAGRLAALEEARLCQTGTPTPEG
jgi:uncharacterized protein HemY